MLPSSAKKVVIKGCESSLARAITPVIVFFVLWFGTRHSFAEPISLPEPSVSFSSGIPRLPKPHESDVGLMLSFNNVVDFKEILILPIANWLREQQFVMRVFNNLDLNWDYSEDWLKQSAANLDRWELDTLYNPVQKGESNTDISGFPFGDSSAINKETDAVRKAYKILWNIAFVQFTCKDIFYQSQLSLIGTQALLRKARGIFYRASFLDSEIPPSEVKQEDSVVVPNNPAKILHKEIFQLLEPPAAYGFAEFAWRYLGLEEDKVWIHSPVIGLTRPVFTSNRSDPLLGSNLSFDDLLVSSTKIQTVSAKVLEEKVLLAPFSALTYYKLESDKPSLSLAEDLASKSTDLKQSEQKQSESKDESFPTAKGFHRRSDGSLAMVVWNYETRRFPQFAPWVPTSVVFVPRRVWIIELSTKDPYYTSGREILIVDQESMLPVYKLVYNHAEEYKKTILGIWGLAKTSDTKLAFPFVAGVLSVNRSGKAATSFTTLQVQTFLGKQSKSSKVIQELLDPAAHKK